MQAFFETHVKEPVGGKCWHSRPGEECAKKQAENNERFCSLVAGRVFEWIIY